MVITYYTPHVSGLTIYARRLAEELARRGHQVTVMASRHSPDLPLQEQIEGVSVVRLPVLLKVNKGVIPPTLLWDAWPLVRRHEVVHMHLPLMGSSFVAWLASRHPRRRTVITYHCDVRPPRSLLSDAIVGVLDLSHRIAAARCDALVANSQDYADHSPFLTRFRRKVETVYPPIQVLPPDPERAARWRSALGLEGFRIVGYAGRFSADKGGDYLLRSIPQVVAALPNVRFVFAGENRRVVGEDFYEKVRPLRERYRDHLLFLGEVTGEQLSDFYSLCDLLALPSVNSTESFGMVQAEAMLCGTPVVASDIPGVREAVRATGMGLTVPPRDETALAQGILEVLLHRERYLAPRIDPCESFGVARTADFYEGLYSRLLLSGG